MWVCPKCGEKIEDQFDSCWKCAAPEEEPARPLIAPAHWRRAFALGVLFEVLLVLLCAVLPRGSWLFIQVFNFLMFSHRPLLWLVSQVPPLALIIILMGGLGMVLVWAFLFNAGLVLVSRFLARFGTSRRQKLLCGYGLGLICAVLSIWAIVDGAHDAPVPFVPSTGAKTLVGDNTAFALDLYRNLKAKPGNIFFSPYSVSSSLALVHAGARGQTEKELAATAHLNLPRETLDGAFSELSARMGKIQRWNRITLLAANSLWCQQGHPFAESFLSVARSCYHADAQFADFNHAAPAADSLNSWVEARTKGRIRGLLDPAQLTPDTSLLLCSAIYFKGTWKVQFKPGDTRPSPFYITPDQTVTVPMMWQKSEFKMTCQLDPDPPGQEIRIIELPYYGGDLSMIILLPGAADGLANLENQLTAENLAAWLDQLNQASPHKVSVRLPRFTTRTAVDLGEALKCMGMPTAFTAKSDFSGIDGTTDLYVSRALHQAFVEVNERGTEAAAVSLFQVKSRSMDDRFNADHPFIFLIRENATGTILFLGRLSDPSQS